MRPQAPERELICFQPYSSKIATLMLSIGLVVSLFFNGRIILADDFDFWDHLNIVIFAFGLIGSAMTRIRLTTHRLIYSFGPFFRYEVLKINTTEIYIAPSPQALKLKKQQDNFFTRKLFVKKPQFNENQPEYWYRNGHLYFISQPKKRAFNQQSLESLSLQLMSEQQRHQLLTHLEQDWGFKEARQVKLNPLDKGTDPLAGQDIGQRVLWLLGLSLLLFIAGFAVLAMGTEGLHLGVESYGWMIPLIIISAVAGYSFIRAEGKAYPLAAACWISFILGASGYFFVLQVNRVYSEYSANDLTTPMTLFEITEHSQVWHLSPGLQKSTGLTEIYVHKTWQGYNSELKQGKSYNIDIKKGAFKDYFLHQESFVDVEEVNIF